MIADIQSRTSVEESPSSVIRTTRNIPVVQEINFFLALRQTAGIVFIFLLWMLAWLLTALPIQPVHALGWGAGWGLALFIPGIWLALHGYSPGKALLGGGMAMLFMTTQTAFFEIFPRVFLFSLPGHPWSSAVLCFFLLLLFGLIAYRISSQSISMLVLLLGVYLLLDFWPTLSSEARSLALLISISLTGLWTIAWARSKSGNIFPFSTQIIVYAVLYLLGHDSAGSDKTSMLLIAIALAIAYLCFKLQDIVRTEKDRPILPHWFRDLYPLLLLYGASWLIFRNSSLPNFWAMPSPFALFMECCILSLLLRRNSKDLLILSLAKLSLALLLLLSLFIPNGPQLVILAGGSIIPAFIGRWKPYKLLRIAEFFLLLTVFILSVSLENFHLSTASPWTTSSDWIGIVVAAGIFCVLSHLHAKWSRRPDAVEGNDSYHDAAGLSYAFMAALITTIHTILTRGDSEALLFTLAAQGALFLGLGILFSTVAVSAAGMLPLVAGVTCFLAFPYLATPSVRAVLSPTWLQSSFICAIALALAVSANRLLKARQESTTSWAQLVSLLTYLPAVYLFYLAAHVVIPWHWRPVLFSVVGILFLLPTQVKQRRLPGLRSAAFLFTFTSVISFFHGRYGTISPVWEIPSFLPVLGLYLLFLLIIAQGAFSFSPLLSQCLVLVTTCIGATGLYDWNNGPSLVFGLVCFALLLCIIGLLCRKHIYFIAATASFLFAVLWVVLSITHPSIPLSTLLPPLLFPPNS